MVSPELKSEAFCLFVFSYFPLKMLFCNSRFISLTEQWTFLRLGDYVWAARESHHHDYGHSGRGTKAYKKLGKNQKSNLPLKIL